MKVGVLKNWAIFPVNVRTPPIEELEIYDTLFDSYPPGQFNFFSLTPWTNDIYTSIPGQNNEITVCPPGQKKNRAALHPRTK